MIHSYHLQIKWDVIPCILLQVPYLPDLFKPFLATFVYILYPLYQYNRVGFGSKRSINFIEYCMCIQVINLPFFPNSCQATIGDTDVCDLCKAASIFAALDQPTQSNNRHSRCYGLPDGKTPCQCQPLPSRTYHLLQSNRPRLNSARVVQEKLHRKVHDTF